VKGNVLLITVDQWRGDCLSALGHPQLETPALDRLASTGVIFANHWANAAPCGPSRACLYTGTYLHQNRSLHNGTPLDARFTNVALLARSAGYDPVLFGYTDTSVDPRTVDPDDPRLFSYEGVLPGFTALVFDPWEQGSPAWGRWLASKGVDVPANPHDLYQPIPDFPGSDAHGATWAPARFAAEHSQTAFIAEEVMGHLEHRGDESFFVHASFIRPHPPRRNPLGYHDRYDADDVAPFVAAAERTQEMAIHPFNSLTMDMTGVGAPADERDRRQLRATYYGAQREVDDGLGRLFSYLQESGLADNTLVVLTSDHGEMGCDHWLTEKLGYWDESYHVPLIVVDPRAPAEQRGKVVTSFTESVDILPTICEWLGIEVPLQADGRSLLPFLTSSAGPDHWRQEAHFEWDFATPDSPMVDEALGIPMSQCGLAVVRGAHRKYVQFGAPQSIFPPLLFDLDVDPHQLVDRFATPGGPAAAFEGAQALLQWRMRHDDRTLSGQMLTEDRGLVEARDTWW